MGEHHPPSTPEEAQRLAERVAADMNLRDRATNALGIRVESCGPGRADPGEQASAGPSGLDDRIPPDHRASV